MKNLYLLTLINLLAISATFGQTIRYVKTTGTAGATGSSWATASNDIQAMINASSAGDTVKIAAGTYKPNRLASNTAAIYNGANATELRQRAFVMKNGVTVVGGYPAAVTTIAQEVYRPIDNKTILSGDFSENDTYGANVALGGNTDNAFNVIIIAGTANQNFHLKGVHVTGGNANHTSTASINGINSFYYQSGGGLSIGSNANSDPQDSYETVNFPNITIDNCVFYRNSTSTRGGAIFAHPKVQLLLRSSIFYENYSAVQGGAIASASYITEIEFCTFYGNKALATGGAVYFAKTSLSQTAYARGSVSNSIFEKNKITSSNSINVLNADVAFGGAANGASNNGEINKFSLFRPVKVQHADFASNVNTIESFFAFGGTDITDEVLFVDENAKDFRLQPQSNLINNGDYTYANEYAHSFKDANGLPRLIGWSNDIGAHEWQYLPDNNGIIYIKPGGTGYGRSWVDATSDLAPVLEFAAVTLYAHSDDFPESNNPNAHGISKIYMAEGTYLPKWADYSVYDANYGDSIYRHEYAPSNQFAHYLLPNDIAIYGSFPATGNPTLSDRNPELFPTILSGDRLNNDIISGEGETLTFANREDNFNNIMIINAIQNDNHVLDGLIFAGGHARTTSTVLIPFGNQIYSVLTERANGAALLIAGSSNYNMEINNCHFRNNFSTGRTIDEVGATPILYGGGAIFLRGGNLGQFFITNSLFSRNSTEEDGSAIFISSGVSSPSNIRITNNTFFGNKATGDQVVYARLPWFNYTFANNIVLGNKSLNDISINFDNLTTQVIKNSLVEGNTVTTNDNIDATGITAANFFQSTVSGNANFLRPIQLAASKNTGSNAEYLSNFSQVDFARNIRLIGANIDLGAFEDQCNTPAPIASNQSICTNGTVNDLVATGTQIQWYSDSIGGTALTGTTALANGTYYVEQTVNNCKSPRTGITVTLTIAAGPTASNQVVCNNETFADLTATGTNLQWYSNSTGGSALTPTDVVTAGTYYVSQTINNCESARTPVTITLSTSTPPTVANQTVCSSTTVSQLVATGNQVQWYSTQTGGTPLASTAFLTTGTYYASQIDNNCESARTAAVITVNVVSPPITTDLSFCGATTAVNLTATGTNIQWYTTQLGGSPISGSTPLATGTYYASQTDNGCESQRATVNVTINNTLAPTASNQSFCSSATVANLVANGTSLAWYTTATAGSPLTSTDLLQTGSYYVSQTLNGCVSNRTPITVTVTTTPPPTVANQTVCYGTQIISLSVQGTGVKWYSTNTTTNTVSIYSNLYSSATYYVSQTINGCESALVPVSITVNPITPMPSVTNQSLCYGATVADLVGTGTSIQWYSTSYDATPLSANTPLNAGTIYATQTINGCESSRAGININLQSTSPPYLIPQTLCEGSTVANLIANGTQVQWYSSVTGGSALPYSTPLATGTYYATSTTNSCESARNNVAITITSVNAPTANNQAICYSSNVSSLVVNGNLPHWYSSATGGTALSNSATLSTGTYYVSQTVGGCESPRTAVDIIVDTVVAPTASNQGFCANVQSTIADLVAQGTQIQWFSAATGGNPLAATTSLQNTTYYATQTVNNCTSQRAPVTVTIANTPALAATTMTICSTNTLDELPITGTQVQWYTNPTGGSPLANNSTLTSGTYYVSQTMNNCESPRTTIPVVVNQVGVPSASNQAFCNNATVANLSGVGSQLQWYTTSTGGTALASTAALSSMNYYLSQTLNGCESPRISVAITVTNPALPVAVAQSFCNSATIGDIVAAGSQLQWYATAAGNNLLVPGTPLQTGNYYVSQTINNCTSARLAVPITVNVTPAPITASQSFCDGTTVSSLIATGNSIKWYATATGGNVLLATAPVSTGTYYASQTINNCESVRTATTIFINVTPTPTASAQTFCNAGTVANLAATGNQIQWYNVATGGAQLTGSTALTSGTYYASQTSNGCESARLPVSITMNVTQPPVVVDQSLCYPATVASLQATGTQVQWFTAQNGGSVLSNISPLNTGTYYVAQTVNNCTSARAAFQVTVNSTPAPTVSNQTLCNNSTVADLVGTGNQIQWYTSANGGTALSNAALVSNGTYFASQTANGCESPRASITLTIETVAAPTSSVQSFCSSATVADLSLTGSNIQWYTTATGGTALAPTVSLNSGTYYASQTIGNCTSNRSVVPVTINVVAAPTASIQYICQSGTVADLQANGSQIQWYSAASGGSALVSTDMLSNGTYYASQTLNSCESPRVAITVNLVIPTTPVASNQSHCESAQIFELNATGSNLQWYDVATGGTTLTPTTAVQSATYYVSSIVNNCESDRVPVDVTIQTAPQVTLATFATMCSNHPAITLNHGSPSGGTYSGSGIINGVFNPSFVPAGTHMITYTVSENGCEGTAQGTVIVDPCLSIEKPETISFTVFPNPATTVVKVQFDASQEGIITLETTDGKRLERADTKGLLSNILEFNTSNLAAGMYIIRFETDHSNIIERVVITK